MPGMTIGKIAAQADVAVDTVRYYERAGLLPEPPRRESGYREYPADAVKRLRFIRRAKALGFSLPEIGELLDLSSSSADVRKRLFTPFFTTKARGTGLGLLTARRLVEAHGGTIAIDCPAGGGTVVTLELPQRIAEATWSDSCSESGRRMGNER